VEAAAMSASLFPDDVLFLQRFLQCSGFHVERLDGIWGPKTDAAARAFEDETERIANREGRFDARSERLIATLQPVAQAVARASLGVVRGAGIDARIISGTRTYEEQNALFRKGRFGNSGPVVTKARGGQSNHNFGIAWDVGIFDNGRYLQESELYDDAGRLVALPGVEWGGNWRTFKDRPHYQLVTSGPISAVRASFESGRALA
jgi:peptidoglycan L-alanyl-D-glutamate endopeptidase CwlK